MERAPWPGAVFLLVIPRIALFEANFAAIVLTIAASRFMPPPLVENIYFRSLLLWKPAFRGLNDETDLPTEQIEAQASPWFPCA